MSDERNYPSRKKNFLDWYMLNMYADRLPECEKSPNFGIKVVNGKVRLDVKTNMPTDKENGYIKFEFSWMDFCTFMVRCQDFIEGRNGGVVEEYSDYTFFKNKETGKNERSEKLALQSTVMVSKCKESGLYFISVFAKDRPKIQFFFKSHYKIRLRHSNGDYLTPEEDSHLCLRGYFTHLKTVLGNIIVKHEDLPLAQASSQSSSQSSPSQGSSGTNSASQFDEFDNDIPF